MYEIISYIYVIKKICYKKICYNKYYKYFFSNNKKTLKKNYFNYRYTNLFLFIK